MHESQFKLFVCCADKARAHGHTGVCAVSRALPAPPLRATIPRMADIQAIVKELQSERARIDAAIKALQGMDGVSARQGKRRKMSAAGRARIAAAQRARWAKIRKAAK